jgi:hypothetical protein
LETICLFKCSSHFENPIKEPANSAHGAACFSTRLLLDLVQSVGRGHASPRLRMIAGPVPRHRV